MTVDEVLAELGAIHAEIEQALEGKGRPSNYSTSEWQGHEGSRFYDRLEKLRDATLELPPAEQDQIDTVLREITLEMLTKLFHLQQQQVEGGVNDWLNG